MTFSERCTVATLDPEPTDDRGPGRPASATPPDSLVQLLSAIDDPRVRWVSLTTTRQGEWALRVRVAHGTPTPMGSLEATCAGHVVVYDIEPD